MICSTSTQVAAEVLKAEGGYDKHRLFGVSVLDVIRSETFLAAELGISNQRILVPVIGGHSGTTIIPLLSKVIGHEQIKADRIKPLTERIQNAGTEVVDAKAGAGSATLSMATAGARFALKVVKGLMGEPGVNEYAYVEGGSKVAPFFAQAVRFGKNGWDEVIDYGTVSEFEQQLIDEAAPQLATNIKKGVDFAQKWLSENK